MATMITDECIGCGACEDVCPNEAISIVAAEDIFIIDPDHCTECVGHDVEQQCQAACPPMVCVPDPDHVETEEQLFEKAKRLCPDEALALNENTSHHRAA